MVVCERGVGARQREQTAPEEVPDGKYGTVAGGQRRRGDATLGCVVTCNCSQVVNMQSTARVRGPRTR